MKRELEPAGDGSQTEKNKPLVLLLTMLLQTLRGHAWSQEVEEAWRSGVEILDNWSKYRVARGSSRQGNIVWLSRPPSGEWVRQGNIVWSSRPPSGER